MMRGFVICATFTILKIYEKIFGLSANLALLFPVMRLTFSAQISDSYHHLELKIWKTPDGLIKEKKSAPFIKSVKLSKKWNFSAIREYHASLVSTDIMASSDGNVTWLFSALFKSSCPIRVRYYPFDDQVNFFLFSWLKSKNSSNVT